MSLEQLINSAGAEKLLSIKRNGEMFSREEKAGKILSGLYITRNDHPENNIFLSSMNSFQHIMNILYKIEVEEEKVNDVIREEVNMILKSHQMDGRIHEKILIEQEKIEDKIDFETSDIKRKENQIQRNEIITNEMLMKEFMELSLEFKTISKKLNLIEGKENKIEGKENVTNDMLMIGMNELSKKLNLIEGKEDKIQRTEIITNEILLTNINQIRNDLLKFEKIENKETLKSDVIELISRSKDEIMEEKLLLTIVHKFNSAIKLMHNSNSEILKTYNDTQNKMLMMLQNVIESINLSHTKIPKKIIEELIKLLFLENGEKKLQSFEKDEIKKIINEIFSFYYSKIKGHLSTLNGKLNNYKFDDFKSLENELISQAIINNNQITNDKQLKQIDEVKILEDQMITQAKINRQLNSQINNRQQNDECSIM